MRSRSAGNLRPDRLEDCAAGKDEIGALMPDAGVGGALGVAHRAKPGDGLVDFLPLEPEPVDRAAVVAGQIEMDAGDRRHRARGAEQMKSAAAPLVGDLVDKRRQRLARHRPVIAAKVLSVTSTPPNFSASDTTPSRIDSHARTLPRLALRGPAPRAR